MLPGYWQAGAFPQLYWQDEGNYWPHFPGVPPPPPPQPARGGVFDPWLLERVLVRDDDEVLILL